MIKVVLETVQAIAHAAVPDVAADANAHSAEQLWIHDKSRGQVAAVFAFQVCHDLRARRRGQLVAVSIVAVRFSTSRRNQRL